VAWVGDESSFQEFIDRHGLTFPQISDDPGDVFARFEIPGQPAFAVVSADGEVQQLLGAVDNEIIDSVRGSVVDG
jgi:peroxiredoxin